MIPPFRCVLLAGMAAVVWAVAGPLGRAQPQEAAVRSPDTETNLFATLDPDRPVDALRVTLPDGWSLDDARLLRYGTEPVPVRVRRTGRTGEYLLSPGTPVRGPHDLVVRVRTGDLPGAYEWTLQSLVRAPADTDASTEFRTATRRTHSVTVESPSPPDPANRALSLAEAAAPLHVRADAVPALGRASSFTIEFWMRTSGLDEVVLSTWNGDETAAYPAEFVVDPGGRLRFYSGRPGQHQALRTGRPVADANWHHVAVVYEARRARLRLLLDGQPTDSLRGRGPPPAPGAVPLAVGGRLDGSPQPEARRPPGFSGEIDELRIWGEARSVEAVRRMKERPYRAPATEDDRRRPLRLGFNAEDPEARDAAVDRWPEGARRVPTTLSFRSGLRDLRARPEGRTVTLQWRADDGEVDQFVVERATGQQPFTEVATLAPESGRSPSGNRPTFSYTDEQVPGQVVFYRVRLRRTDGTERTSGTIKVGLGPDSEKDRPVELIGNFPNPFAETTTVAYDVNEPQPVTITVWDLQGHKIAHLADGVTDPGYHEVAFDATDLPSGNYFVRLETPGGKQSHTMVVLK